MHAAFTLNGVKYECKRVRGQRNEVEEWYIAEALCTGKTKAMSRLEFLTKLRDILRDSGADEIMRGIYGVAGIGG